MLCMADTRGCPIRGIIGYEMLPVICPGAELAWHLLQQDETGSRPSQEREPRDPFSHTIATDHPPNWSAFAGVACRGTGGPSRLAQPSLMKRPMSNPLFASRSPKYVVRAHEHVRSETSFTSGVPRLVLRKASSGI